MSNPASLSASRPSVGLSIRRFIVLIAIIALAVLALISLSPSRPPADVVKSNTIYHLVAVEAHPDDQGSYLFVLRDRTTGDFKIFTWPRARCDTVLRMESLSWTLKLVPPPITAIVPLPKYRVHYNPFSPTPNIPLPYTPNPAPSPNRTAGLLRSRDSHESPWA